MPDDPFKDPFIRRITSKDSELRQRIDVARCNSDEQELHRLYNDRYHMFLAYPSYYESLALLTYHKQLNMQSSQYQSIVLFVSVHHLI